MNRFWFVVCLLFTISPSLLNAEGLMESLNRESLLMTNQADYPDEYETLYLERFRAIFGGGGATSVAPTLGGYDPLASILGVETFTPLSRSIAGYNTISESALNSVRSYAAQRNSHALIVWRKGRVEEEFYFGNQTRDSLIVSFSLAKPISVLAVGRAIQEGHIDSLDQRVSDYFPEWRGTAKERILIRHLLDMRSGLLPQIQDLDPKHIINRAYLHPIHEKIIINDYPIVHEPGSRYEYSNVTSDLVAPLIERATGLKYEEWLSKSLIIPLGAKGGKVWLNRPGGMVHSACCALFPADTYLRIALLVLFEGRWNGAQLLPSNFTQEMKTPTQQNIHAGMGLYVGKPYKERRGPLNPEQSFGTILHSEPYLADDLVLFDGNANQVAYIVPSEELIVLRLGNWPDRGVEWDNSYLPNTIVRGIVDR